MIRKTFEAEVAEDIPAGLVCVTIQADGRARLVRPNEIAMTCSRPLDGPCPAVPRGGRITLVNPHVALEPKAETDLRHDIEADVKALFRSWATEFEESGFLDKVTDLVYARLKAERAKPTRIDTAPMPFEQDTTSHEDFKPVATVDALSLPGTKVRVVGSGPYRQEVGVVAAADKPPRTTVMVYLDRLQEAHWFYRDELRVLPATSPIAGSSNAGRTPLEREDAGSSPAPATTKQCDATFTTTVGSTIRVSRCSLPLGHEQARHNLVLTYVGEYVE